MHFSVLPIAQTKISDPCSEENLRPNPTAIRGQNQVLSAEQRKKVIEIALQDGLHCHKPLHELESKCGLEICSNTLSNILSADGIHRRHPTQKPFLNMNAKAARLAWAIKYQHFNFTKVLFTDKSLFEASVLCSARAKGVLRRAGERYLSQNLDMRFPKGQGAMFWGGIIYRYAGSELPYYFFPTPIESKVEREAAIGHLE